MTAQQLVTALAVYLTLAAIFFLTCFKGAKEALQKEIDSGFSSKAIGLLVFMFVHLLVSLMWPIACTDMIRTFMKACK